MPIRREVRVGNKSLPALQPIKKRGRKLTTTVRTRNIPATHSSLTSTTIHQDNVCPHTKAHPLAHRLNCPAAKIHKTNYRNALMNCSTRSLSLFLFPTRPAVEPITVHWALLFGSPVSSECSAVLWNAFAICLHFFTSTNARWVFDFYGMTLHHPLKMAQLAHTTQNCVRNRESAHERYRPLFEAVNTNFCVSHRLYCLFVACFSSPKKLKKTLWIFWCVGIPSFYGYSSVVFVYGFLFWFHTNTMRWTAHF